MRSLTYGHLVAGKEPERGRTAEILRRKRGKTRADWAGGKWAEWAEGKKGRQGEKEISCTP